MSLFKEEIQSIINEIESKYNFKDGFSLAEKLSELPNRVSMFKQKVKDYPRLSKMKKNIDTLTDLSNKLNDALRKTHFQTQIFMQDIPHTIAAKTGYMNLQKQSEDWDIVQFINDLEVFRQISQFASEFLEKDVGGRKSDSIPQYVIFALASIYESGTGIEPTCGWNEIDDIYVGTFFEFLLSLGPVLKELGLKLGTYKSTGRNAIKSISHYREEREHLKSDNAYLQSLSTCVV